MTEDQAREFFLEKIRLRLAEEGKSLGGLEFEYWQALKPKDEKLLKAFVTDKRKRKEFTAIEERFECALRKAVSNDLAVDGSARDRYISAMKSIVSVEGIQLQAIVFAATAQIKELDESKPWQSVLATVSVLLLLVLGAWIGFHLRK